ncbi:MAG: hypothetical protein ACREC6_10700 [Hyphomicrobiaceae bacterium]
MTGHATITGNTALDGWDHVRAYYWSAPKSNAFLVILIFASIILPFLFRRFDSMGLFMIFGAIMLASIFFALATFPHRRLSHEQKQIAYEIDAQNIITRDRTGAAITFPWSIVRRMDERGSGFAIALRPAGTRWLAKRAFTADALAALRSLAKEKLGDAARVET